jgi:hypothetical protein
MRISEIINENSESDQDTKILKVSDMFGGGKIITNMVFDKNNDVETYSYSYENDKIVESDVVVSYSVDENDVVTVYHGQQKTTQTTNIDDDEIRKLFATEVGNHMNNFFMGKRKMNEQSNNQHNTALEQFMKISDFIIKSRQNRRNRMAQELEEASNGSMGAMPGKTYSPQPVNKAVAKINAITKR